MERFQDHVRVASEKGRAFSVEDLPEQALKDVQRTGASVAEEFRYDVECGGPARSGIG
jgi:hypothetical protein